MNSEQNHDIVTGANPTPHMVPEFLTGRPMQSREPLQRHNSTDHEPQETIPQVLETTAPTTPSDPINRLAEVLVGMNNRPPAQTLMVRPVKTTTLTFDGKSEKFELFEDLFHTMNKKQPDMTETMKIKHFHSLLRKNALQTFRNINTANRQTLEDILAVFRRKYVKPESQATTKHKWHRLVFDPNTMKLPDFLEELNQGAEKAFGDIAQAMIDSLLYAKLPPKLKRSVNMVRLENATYEEIVTHLERELELNGLEEGDDIPVPTMSTAPTAKRPGTGLLSSGIDPNVTCNYCKKPGHVKDDCRKLKRKEEQRRNDGQDTKKEYAKCPTCDKTNHPAERCWKGAGAHLKPKNLKMDDTTVTDTSTCQEDTKKANYFNLKKYKKRLQLNTKLKIRQYVMSDPPNKYYTEYYTALKETPSADWQQQMKTLPISSTTLDPMSTGLQHDTSTIRLIHSLTTITRITLTLTMVLTPSGTLIATINIIYTSTIILTNHTRTSSQTPPKLIKHSMQS